MVWLLLILVRLTYHKSPCICQGLVKWPGLVATTFSPTWSTTSPSHDQEEGAESQGLSCYAYLPLLVTILHAQSIHGPHNGCQRLDGVAVDDRLVLLYVFSREAIFMDDPGGKTINNMR